LIHVLVESVDQLRRRVLLAGPVTFHRIDLRSHILVHGLHFVFSASARTSASINTARDFAVKCRGFNAPSRMSFVNVSSLTLNRSRTLRRLKNLGKSIVYSF
jgi:hypothetical protein